MKIVKIVMGTDVLKSYDTLQQELDKAKSNLKGLNDNIRRIIGREPQDIHLRGDRKRNFNDSRRNDFNNSDRQKNRELSPISIKRRQQETKSVFSRLSGPPISRDDEQKPKIHSRVIRELPTRQEIVAAQGVDEESRARNKRMFGCLLGTLQKFCQEESRLKQKEDMKAQIEKKLEEQEIKERENLRKERQTLFYDRKRQQLEIRKLELKMTRLREFEIWEKTKKDLFNFIKTKSKPHIYFKPKLKNEKLEKRLADCRSELEQEIEKKRAALNEEIMAIENRFKLQEENLLEKVVNHSENTKHNRCNANYENDDDVEDDEHDSIYNDSDDNDADTLQNNRLHSVLKTEKNEHKNNENHSKDSKKDEKSQEYHKIDENNSFKLDKDKKLE